MAVMGCELVGTILADVPLGRTGSGDGDFDGPEASGGVDDEDWLTAAKVGF